MIAKIAGAIVALVVLSAAWFFTQGPGVAMLHKEQTTEAAPAPQPQPEPEVTERHVAPQNHVRPDPAVSMAAPIDVPPEQPAPTPAPQQQDASSNRGMQFLLNQGKN